MIKLTEEQIKEILEKIEGGLRLTAAAEITYASFDEFTSDGIAVSVNRTDNETFNIYVIL